MKLKKPAQAAAGFPALISTARHILREMSPTRGFRILAKMNQKAGFDCPGCAWPDPAQKRSSLGEYCENGAKAIAEEATTKKITLEFFQKYSVTELSQQSDFWLSQQGRLTQPMLLKPESVHYQPISWQQAFALIGTELKSLDSPNEAVFYTSGRTSNEAAFLYQLFVRMYGTNNMPDCSNMCHESSGTGLSQTLGIGKGSVTLEDFDQAEVIIVAGQNPGTNHPRMLTALQKAKEKGARIISINPLAETGLVRFQNPQDFRHYLNGGIHLTDIFLQVKINEDVTLLKALMKILYEKEKKSPGKVFDLEFIQKNTQGFEDFLKELENYSLEDLITKCGVSKEKIEETAKLLTDTKRIILCWAMGLTQHKNGVANVRECVNLLLLKGSIGKPGAGTCPVRGHSNVQGDRTMGIWEKPPAAFLDKLSEVFDFQAPRKPGYNTVEAIQAMAEGKARVFIALGGNFLSATPDTEFTAKALQNCQLTVQISTKLNRSHLIHGQKALILPCLGRTEIDLQKSGLQFQTVENSMGFVHATQGHIQPASTHLLSEPAIVAGIAQATLGNTASVNWAELTENYDRIRDKIAQVIPGFENYHEKVKNGEGFYLPNAPRVGKFNTPDQKAHFSLNPLPENPLQEGEYLMMTIRSHDQFNTTIYGLNDRYRGIYNERRVVLMNPEDIKAAKLEKLQAVDLTSHYEGEIRTAQHFLIIPYEIPRQCVATYFPEANVLIPLQHFADQSHTPASKSVVIRMKAV
ncbi:MAG: FdhF/YdeP family oxidoreductase [Microscillaceae bacterium]|nr:FdhF/YdeP family oxidoreductase [Microscillaceae bacterium]